MALWETRLRLVFDKGIELRKFVSAKRATGMNDVASEAQYDKECADRQGHRTPRDPAGARIGRRNDLPKTVCPSRQEPASPLGDRYGIQASHHSAPSAADPAEMIANRRGLTDGR